MYVQGGSSTLPEEVQLEMYRTIIGLEKVEFMRIAHAIEYDCIDPTILKTTLEHNSIENLYYAGQINGSSGYEEAAAQGLMAGINAVLKIKGEKPFILDRSEAYIGVLIDDLVTKGTNEPYRMMTSRAEYRLTLRQDNADLRLTEKGYKIGIVSAERYKKMLVKKELVEGELSRLREVKITPKPEVNDLLEKWKTSSLKTTSSLYELIKRPELNYELLKVLDESRPSLPREIKLQVETHIKYEGYIRKQMAQIEQFKKLEEKKLSTDFDYSKVKGMRIEAVQKLNNIKPDSIGQE